MLVKFRCRSCFAKVSADDEVIGKEVNCPSCNEKFVVPQPQFGFGKVLGGYEIEQSLGSGAMGEVYLARQVSMNRPVALKVIKHDIAMDREVVDRFTHEAQTLARLNHPNIVPAFDAGYTEDCYYMAMGYIDGETLEDNLKRQGPMDEVELIKIVLKVVNALEYAWGEFKLLHRDIKPANIMIDKMGEVRIMDMGIAKNTAEDGGLTRVGLVVGTPFFMSPEQAQASVGIDYKSDVYALAASMYQMLTGILPFQGPNVMSILAKKVNSPVIPPHEIKPYISAETSALVVRLLDYQPAKRFEDFEDLKSMLNKCLAVAEKQKEQEGNTVKTKYMKVPEEIISQARTERMEKSQNLKAMQKPNQKNKILVSLLVGVIAILTLLLVLFEPEGKMEEAKELDSSVAKAQVISDKEQEALSEMFADDNSIGNDDLSVEGNLRYSLRSKFKGGGLGDLQSRGEVYMNKSAGMVLKKGAFFKDDFSADFDDSFEDVKGFSIQITFSLNEDGLNQGVLFSYGENERHYNVRIVVEDRKVYLETRHVQSMKHVENRIKLFEVEPGSQRLLVSYKSGRLLVLKEGIKVFEKTDISGLVSGWQNYPLVFGDHFQGPHNFLKGEIFNFYLFSTFIEKHQMKELGGKGMGRKGDKKKRFGL